MSRTCLLLAVATAAHAAVIRGVVVENQSSRPLARAQVILQPVAGTPAASQSIRTDRYGNFAFTSLPAGAYVLKASRRGFMPMEYGQKQWNSAGVPLATAEDGSSFLTLRLPRFGGITGTLVDENDVGLPDGEVLAYRYTQPPVLAARARSDERGVYRISGLEPGPYLVRSAAFQDGELSYLPTFSREAVRSDESRPVQVYPEQDSGGVDVRPLEGRLITISGRVYTYPSGLPVTVTLVSDMGRLTSQGITFRFGPLAPGVYEIFAETPVNPAPGASYQAAYLNLGVVSRDTSVPLELQTIRESQFDINPAPAGGSGAGQILARRKDLAGAGEPQALQLSGRGALLAPGRWELYMAPPPGYYVSSFSGSRTLRPEGSRADVWNETLISPFGSFHRFGLSSPPGAVHGLVKLAGEPVPGAPVYLEAYDPATRRRLKDLQTTRTDMRGVFRLEGLAPGTYRILSTFEYNAPDTPEMDYANSKSILVSAREDAQADLDLFVIR